MIWYGVPCENFCVLCVLISHTDFSVNNVISGLQLNLT